MFSLSLVTLGLATIGAYAKPMVPATASLEVSLSTPASKVTSVYDLTVVATVKNVGDEDLKVIKLGSVLDNEHSTRAFIVTKDGKQVPFTGVETSVPTDHLSENDWVVIQVGESVIAEHDVSAVYDFSAAGSGTFTFDPVPRFQVVGLNDAVEANTTHSVSITVSDDVSKRELDLEKRSTVQCDINADKDRYGRMLSAAGNVYSLAATAGWYISVKGTDDPIYRRYFGKLPKDLVLANFKAIKDMDRWVTLDCSCPSHNCKPGRCLQKDPVYSTVTLVYFCDPFFTPSYHPVNAFCTNPTDVDYNRVGVTFRVYATLLPSTRIVESSCDQAANSIDSDKLKNTYSYACFAAEVYKSDRC